MFKMSNDYRTYKERGVSPIVYCFITSTRNTRVYGTIPPDDSEIGVTQLASCDGSIVAGDGTYLGALPIVEYAPRVLNFGTFRETLIPIQRDFLTSLTMTEIGSFLVTLDNTDAHFSELLGDDKDEQFLGSICDIYQGFQGLSFGDFIKIIRGEITELILTQSIFSLIAEAI